jgi:Xaa-Pro aminopeptidase
MNMHDFPGKLDRARMRRERFAKLQREMNAAGADALLLLGTSNTYYASGAGRLSADSGRAKLECVSVLVKAGDAAPHVFTPFPEGLPPELPDDHRHDAIPVEFDAGVAELADWLRQLIGARRHRLGIDQYSAAMFESLPRLAPGADVVDASAILNAARLVKTVDEIECLRRAQRINDLAMADVQKHLRPGVGQAELTGLFYRRIHEMGAETNVLDPMWDVIGRYREDFAPSTHGDLPFPLVATDKKLADGTVLWMDTGITYDGYASDFGRTWIVGDNPSPTSALRDQYRRYRDVIAAVLDVAKPGKTGYDLTCVAKKAGGGKVWLDHFYLGHGIGLSSAEAPLIGTDLGEDFDRAIELREGLIIVLEPVCWTEGVGGFRAEETIALTEDGYVKLNDYPYTPFA